VASVEAGPEAAANWTEEFLSLVQADREQGLVPASEAYKQVSSFRFTGQYSLFPLIGRFYHLWS
jgi:hypothetical protein